MGNLSPWSSTDKRINQGYKTVKISLFKLTIIFCIKYNIYWQFTVVTVEPQKVPLPTTPAPPCQHMHGKTLRLHTVRNWEFKCTILYTYQWWLWGRLCGCGGRVLCRDHALRQISDIFTPHRWLPAHDGGEIGSCLDLFAGVGLCDKK